MRERAPRLEPSEPVARDGEVGIVVRDDANSADFSRLLREHGRGLARLAATHERDRDEQQDLLQDIAFALWKALPTFRRECGERTFVYRIAHNRAMTHCARRRLRTVPLDSEPEQADPALDPANAAIQHDSARRLRRSVQQLPDLLRQAVVLRLEGLSNTEIGEVLGISENNVAVRLTRARTFLRAELHPTEGGS